MFAPILFPVKGAEPHRRPSGISQDGTAVQVALGLT